MVGTIFVGFLIAFLVPSTTARVACLVPITLGIIAAFGVNRKGAFASMLMITTVQTASIWNVGIKTAAAQNMVAIGFIEKAFGRTITWLEWLVAAAPFGVLMSVALYFVMTRMMPPEVTQVPGGRAAIRRSLDDLGPAGFREETPGDFAHAAGVLGDRRRAAPARHQHDHGHGGRAHVPAGHRHHHLEGGPAEDPMGHHRSVWIGISLGTALLQTKGALWLADTRSPNSASSTRPRCSSLA